MKKIVLFLLFLSLTIGLFFLFKNKPLHEGSYIRYDQKHDKIEYLHIKNVKPFNGEMKIIYLDRSDFSIKEDQYALKTSPQADNFKNVSIRQAEAKLTKFKVTLEKKMVNIGVSRVKEVLKQPFFDKPVVLPPNHRFEGKLGATKFVYVTLFGRDDIYNYFYVDLTKTANKDYENDVTSKYNPSILMTSDTAEQIIKLADDYYYKSDGTYNPNLFYNVEDENDGMYTVSVYDLSDDTSPPIYTYLVDLKNKTVELKKDS
ncbi:hypothetical protein [Gottfriedia solisilvae]|uniref:Uncharacterized protein n=1 Tax=Gottfriedia solisilvae TaxID=1516104 RepID=A0A8J3AJR3_9BACI|nr:hypothetical protein [Gottfriedia solisilvae]GGI11729.1 hypothetical protein GCM10007380_09300 [Gottfriedia solisilvae]